MLITSLFAVLVILASAVSCNREFDFGFKDLCFYHPHTAPVRVKVDWSLFRHLEQPDGMSVYVWPRDPEEEEHTFLTHNLNSITLDLEAGFYDAFVYNQSSSEFSTIEFHNLESFEKAEVRVKTIEDAWYSTRAPGTKVGNEPEWLAVDCLMGAEVTEEMVAVAEAEYLAALTQADKNQRARQITKSQNDIATLIPTSVVKKLDVYVHLENMPFLRSAIGAVEGLAEGCYISTKQTTGTPIAHTLEKWSIVYEQDENGAENFMKGAIKATIPTFGLPAGHTGSDGDNKLFVKLLLVDNQTILEMDFPVGEEIADLNTYNGTQLDENGNVIWPEIHVYWPEPLPEVEPMGGSNGAFDVGVGDWGDEIVTVLPLL